MLLTTSGDDMKKIQYLNPKGAIKIICNISIVICLKHKAESRAFWFKYWNCGIIKNWSTLAASTLWVSDPHGTREFMLQLGSVPTAVVLSAHCLNCFPLLTSSPGFHFSLFWSGSKAGTLYLSISFSL